TGNGKLVPVSRGRGHDQHPVIQLVAELVVGHVLHVLDGERPVLYVPGLRNGHDTHGALLLSCSPPCPQVPTSALAEREGVREGGNRRPFGRNLRRKRSG